MKKEVDPQELRRYDAMQKLFMMPNARSIGVVKTIEGYYPALAKKVFENNPIMDKFVNSGYNTMDIMKFPVCDHCESLAAWSGGAELVNGKYVPVCSCFKCGLNTSDPTLFKEWIIQELKKRAPDSIRDTLEVVVDVMAERLVNQAKREYKKILIAERVEYV